MFEALIGVRRVDLQVPMRVARHIGGAQLADLGLHGVARSRGGADEVDLIALDGPPRKVAGIVRNERVGGKGFDLSQQPR